MKKHLKAAKYSKGLTLIEMMISMTLGMVIILGLTSVYLSSQKSAGTRNSVATMEANARIALFSLRQIIEHAGYPSIYNVPLEKPFHTTADGAIDVNLKCRDGTEEMVRPDSIANKKTIDSNDRDRIIVKYMADNPDDENAEISIDCLGSEVLPTCSADPSRGLYNSMEAVVYNAIYIDSGSHSLVCSGSLTHEDTANPESTSIAEDISALQFLYGVNTGTSTTYKTATAVETAKQWESVTSVQVAILVRSSANVLQTTESRTFVLLNQTVSKNDKRLYRVYSTTINLPNRNRRVL
ncbi:MAG: PilW family protein [Cocleimonas sp.]|nr:PilW family protein [Cocleimonas sp.]